MCNSEHPFPCWHSPAVFLPPHLVISVRFLDRIGPTAVALSVSRRRCGGRRFAQCSRRYGRRLRTRAHTQMPLYEAATRKSGQELCVGYRWTLF